MVCASYRDGLDEGAHGGVDGSDLQEAHTVLDRGLARTMGRRGSRRPERWGRQRERRVRTRSDGWREEFRADRLMALGSGEAELRLGVASGES